MSSDLSAALDHFSDIKPDEPYWTESSWFSWAIPERDICGLIWTHFRPNMNCVCGGPAMWDRSGEHPWKFRYFDFQTMRLLPEGKWGRDYDKYDFATPWSLTIRMVRPLEAYKIDYWREGFTLDLTFEAIAPPNIMHARDLVDLRNAFRLHFEQPGRIHGHVALDGERIAVDTFSIRDGGHGPRFMETAKPGGYTWSTADARNGWHILAPNAADGREAKVIGGYILRDGVMSPAVDGVRRVLARAGPRPEAIEIEVVDELGREVHARGRAQTPAEFMLFPERGQWWTLFRWTYDGFLDAVGEDQEYYGIHELRRWHRAGPDAWSKR